MSKLSIFLCSVIFSSVSDVMSYTHISNYLPKSNTPFVSLDSYSLRRTKSDAVCLSQQASTVFRAIKSRRAISTQKFSTPVRLQQSSSVFERLSSSFMSVDSHPLSWEDIMGSTPEGPDPVQLTQSDMRLLKKRIKGVIERNLGSGDSTHPLLKSSSKDFFERSEKAWRPMVLAQIRLMCMPQPTSLLEFYDLPWRKYLMSRCDGVAAQMTLLLSNAIAALKAQGSAGESSSARPDAHHDDAMTVSEIVEIMHTSTLIHDTVRGMQVLNPNSQQRLARPDS